MRVVAEYGIGDLERSHMKGPVVLGVNAAHDSAACLLIGGRLVCAIGEERLSRRKFYQGYPHQAVGYCLEEVGLTMDDVDCIVMNQYGYYDCDQQLYFADLKCEKIVNPSHHLLHAYYAIAASGFEEAAVLILDGSGYSYGEHSRRGSPLLGPPPPYSEMEEAQTTYVFSDGTFSLDTKRWALWEAQEPLFRFASLGHMYSSASIYIFGHMQHAGKTMGLAPFGDASAFPDPIISFDGDEVVIDTTWTARLPPRSATPPQHDQVCTDLAAKVQSELEKAVLFLAEGLYARTGLPRLALSGGVALNSVTNGRLQRESKFSEIFVTPAAGDAGVAIGAALYGHSHLTGSLPSWDYRNDYHGRLYPSDEIDAALTSAKSALTWEIVGDESGRLAAQDAAGGKVVGWFELGSEFGPRSLGHRTIVCDARDPQMRDKLNSRVKFRELFRPYAASVLAERAPEFFDLDVEDPYMLVVAPVREAQRSRIPSVCHVDGTCRVQTVTTRHPGQFRTLIEEFDLLTGVPLVLNTSFNIRGEPIVETPEDAVECFLASNFDVLYIEGRRVLKEHIAESAAPRQLVPVLTAGVALRAETLALAGVPQAPSCQAIARTGHRMTVTEEQMAALSAIDGVRSCAELAARAGVVEDPIACFAGLQELGLVYFRRSGERVAWGGSL